MAKFLNTCLEETIDLPFLKVKREKYSHLTLSSLIVWSCCFCRVSMIGSYDHQIDIFCLAHYFFVAKNVQNERVQKVVIVTLWPILCCSQRPTYHEHCTHGGHFYPISIVLARLPDFVPFDTCQVQESQFWDLFFKKLKKSDVENFWGSSRIRRKTKKKLKE